MCSSYTRGCQKKMDTFPPTMWVLKCTSNMWKAFLSSQLAKRPTVPIRISWTGQVSQNLYALNRSRDHFTTSNHISKRNEDVRPHNNVYVNVQSSFRHSIQGMQINQNLIDEWINMGISIQWIVFKPKKRWSADLCYNMDELWEHTKWKKVVTKIAHCVIPLIWNVQKK